MEKEKEEEKYDQEKFSKNKREIEDELKDENLIIERLIYIREKKGEIKLSNRSLYKAVKKDNDKEMYCVKIIDACASGSSNEISIIKKLREDSSNLLFKCREVTKKNKHYLISTYYEYSLREYMGKNKGKFTIEEIRHIMKDVVNGLNLFQKYELIHRDLKPENLMIDFKDKNGNDKDLLNSNIIIIDFGLSICGKTEKQRTNKEQVGTKGYFHPKILEYDLKQELDIWSLGVICLELFKGSEAKVQNGKYIIPLKENTPLELVRFIDKMLQQEPTNQAKLNELSEDVFLNRPVNTFKSFKDFLLKGKMQDKIIKLKEEDGGGEGIELSYTSSSGLNFVYDKKEDNIDELINECFVELNENFLFTKPVIFPIIATLNK